MFISLFLWLGCGKVKEDGKAVMAAAQVAILTDLKVTDNDGCSVATFT